MTTDVTWDYFEQVRRPPEWRTLHGRITYMMGRRLMRSKAQLGRAAEINPKQIANQLARIQMGGDLELETIKAYAKALKCSVGWLANDEGWPNAEERKAWGGDDEVCEVCGRPPIASGPDAIHRSTSSHPPVRPLHGRPKTGN